MILLYLYVKKHRITGLKYFGRTKRNPYKYKGSGIYWNLHLDKHGKEFVDTIDVWEFFTLEEAKTFAIKFSKDNNIVESNEWANLVIEDTRCGFIGKPHTEETKAKMRKAHKSRAPKSIETREKLKLSLIGHPVSEETKSKISNSVKGFIHTEESKIKMRGKRGSQPKLTCPHCGNISGASSAKRHHFDKCKSYFGL